MAGNDLCSTHFRVHNSYIFVITIQFLFCFLRIIKAKYILLFCSFVNKFTILFYDLAAVAQIWPWCLRFGCHVTNLASKPQIWPPSMGLVVVLQIWPPSHRFDFQAKDLAAVSQIWRLCHRFGRCVINWTVMRRIWLLPQI